MPSLSLSLSRAAAHLVILCDTQHSLPHSMATTEQMLVTTIVTVPQVGPLVSLTRHVECCSTDVSHVYVYVYVWSIRLQLAPM